MAQSKGNPSSNPFDHAFEMLGHMPEITTDNVNSEALELLTQALTSRSAERGRMVLLRSPRAGFGKTHLLMRLHQRVAHTHEFIPLEPSKGRYLDAQSVLDAVLRRFSRVLPAGGGLTVLDLLARRILATGLEPLVKSGEVPSQDRDSALQALQLRPVETFDFHNEDAVTARWAMANFSLLGPRLTAELAERTHAGYRPVAWWVELLFRYSSAGVDQTSRNSSLFETVFGSDSVETDMHEKLVTLLNLTGLVTSPVLLLDEVEGFSSNPEAALQVATFLNALHQSCNKLALIISVNGDVWETAFLPRIPCGLKDRLSDIVIDLKPMDKDAAISLLKDRAGEHAHAIADTMDFDTGVIYARGLIREASSAWEDIAAEQRAHAPEVEREVALEPISLLAPDATEDESNEVDTEPGRELHAPAAVVLPGATPSMEPPVFDPTPSADSASSVFHPESTSEPSEATEPAPAAFESVATTTSDEPPVTVAPEGASTPDYGSTAIFEPTTAFEPDPFVPGAAAPEVAAPDMQQPQLPDDLPQPFGPQGAPKEPFQMADQPVTQSETVNPGSSQEDTVSGSASPFSIAKDDAVVTTPTPTPTPTPGSNPPAPTQVAESAPVTNVPQNVIESPFSIDTGATNIPSPFESVQPAQAPAQPVQSPPAPPVEQTPPAASAPTPAAPVESPFSIDDGKPAAHTVTDNDHEKVEDLLKQFRDRYGRD